MGKFIVTVRDDFAIKDGEGYQIPAQDKASDLAMPFITSIEWDQDNGSGFYIKDDGTTHIATAPLVEHFMSLWETAKHEYDLSLELDLPMLKYLKRIDVKYYGRDRGKIYFTRVTTSGKTIKMQVRHTADYLNIANLVTWVMSEQYKGNTNSVIKFRDGNNVTHDLTHDDCIEVYDFAREYMDSIFQVTWDHKNAIDALGTKEEVENYDYTTGWPPIT